MSECQKCDLRVGREAGRCAQCGAVCLRREPWSPAEGTVPAATPIIQSRIPELNGAWLKFEGANPSSSFKDRVMDVLVREAVEDGAKGAIVASSGNAAVAAATHAARHGLPLLILVPESVPETIVALTALRGATLLRGGEGPAAVHGLAALLSGRLGLPNLASTFGASGCEWACRSIGHEIAAQLPSQSVRTVAAAVSVGPVLLGTATGLVEAGRDLPRMIAGQAAGCAPIARAFAQGDATVLPWEGPTGTRATSIADRLTGYAPEASFFLERVRAGGGAVLAADDSRLREIRSWLARYDGLDVELSSCAAVAALIDSGHAADDAVCVLTGGGMRETLATEATIAAAPGLDDFCERVIADATTRDEVKSWIAESLS